MEDPEGAGSAQDLVVPQKNFTTEFPCRPSSKREVLITLKEKNKDVNEKYMWLQMHAGVHCQCFCLFKKSSAPLASEGGEKFAFKLFKNNFVLIYVGR